MQDSRELLLSIMEEYCLLHGCARDRAWHAAMFSSRCVLLLQVRQ